MQSGTRVYLPKKGEWASVDNAILWNPEALLAHPRNWLALEYGSGDSLNNVDSGGTWAAPVLITSLAFILPLIYKEYNIVKKDEEAEQKIENIESKKMAGTVDKVAAMIDIDKIKRNRQVEFKKDSFLLAKNYLNSMTQLFSPIKKESEALRSLGNAILKSNQGASSEKKTNVKNEPRGGE